MFASMKINAILTGLIMTGCACSPEFAAALVAGSLGAAIAAAVIFGIHGGPDHPVQIVMRKGRELFTL